MLRIEVEKQDAKERHIYDADNSCVFFRCSCRNDGVKSGASWIAHPGQSSQSPLLIPLFLEATVIKQVARTFARNICASRIRPVPQSLHQYKLVTLIFSFSNEENVHTSALKSVVKLGLSMSWVELTPRICSAREGDSRSLEVPRTGLRSWRRFLGVGPPRQLEG